jgi:integrase
MLAMHTGQRQGDLRRLPWSAYDGERIALPQGKGGGKVEVSIRCTKALKLMLDDMSRSKCGPLLLTTKTGARSRNDISRAMAGGG